ncbi:MAG: hypothetical protein B5M54_07590 [Candidatus Aminicenantes bacterium 4484_214]|nr:MAG: hypothetical protein B5M54_07590 [Candidatus Aminicenantes bacterium 4484_214]
MSLFVDSEKCTGCGLCLPICPVEAISIAQNKAVIDNDKCTECLNCMNECPVNAIYQILDKKVPVIKKKEPPPTYTNPNVSQPEQPFWIEKQQKQQPVKSGDIFLSIVKRLVNNFLRNESSFGKKRRGRGHGRHGKGWGRRRH